MKNKDDLIAMARKYDFDLVKENKRSLVFENQNIRFKTRFNEAGKEKRLQCDLIMPNQKEALALLFKGREITPGSARIDGEQLQYKDLAKDHKEFEKILLLARNISELAKENNPNAIFLKSLPEIAREKIHIDEKALDTFAERLEDSRVLLANSDSLTLSAYIRELKAPCAYEIDPACLLNNPAEIFSNIESLATFNGSILCFNLNLLEEQKQKGLIKMLERYAHSPCFYGARFLLFFNGIKPGSSRMPSITLPDINMTLKQALEENGLPADESALNILRAGINNGKTIEEAMENLTLEKNYKEDLGHASNLRTKRKKTFRKRQTSSLSVKELLDMAWEIKNYHVVGNNKIWDEIIRAVISWHVLEPTEPLVIAKVGPTGTGKNIGNEALSEILGIFNKSAPHYVCVNVAAMVDKYSLWQLTGVQAGLKGMEQPGILESIQDYSVVSFDEMDKQRDNPFIEQFLIELLDNHSFRNNFGKTIRVPKSIIVLTMNAGADSMDEKWEKIGFGPNADAEENNGLVIQHYKKAYERNLTPALRGRVHRAFYFPPLTQADLLEIARRKVMLVKENFKQLALAWPYEDGEDVVLREILENCDGNKLGARGVLNKVNEFKHKLFKEVITNTFQGGKNHGNS